ncbi:type I DNA topoisomerase [Patescibacteria group bacterium]|nr:type I DNA topoisomerase [Patescibacteria group bacterium]MBU4579853.1 type I DNA topoisomerase [Patescibacteria group bacterium]
MNLIIVESPTKAKTISKFLSNDYIVRSSFGHVRDLPKSKLGVDTENNFEPEYVANPKSKKHIAELKNIASEADKIILASDEDREGEAISWHLTQILNLGNNKSQISNPKQNSKNKIPNKTQKTKKEENQKPYERIVFHEITKTAIEKALANPRQIDMNLVNAQQARRVLDRLVGYELSPLLWKKIRFGLSAGRVQSVAVRLIVEREEEIKKFIPDEYWEIKSKVKSQKSKAEFEARLAKINDKVLPKLGIKTKEEAEKIKNELEKSTYKVLEIKKKETERNPLPPFTTSTLQQASSNTFGYSAKQTMMIAQQLYEGMDLGASESVGLITYMRTDSLNLSEDALATVKAYIGKNFGARYTIDSPRRFKTKSKGAQEAHEAIRPTDPAKSPESVKEFLDSKQFKLYSLIWQRMVATQMASAKIDSTSIDISANAKDDNYILRATGSIIKFDGFLRIYPSKSEEIILPELEKEEELDLIKVTSDQHFTSPPARYNEASLIKIMEEYGIGRPSTYAPTISTIQDRGYVEKKEKRFYPKEIGVIVNKVLVEHFSQIVDIKFTARMEENLDEIAENKKQWVPVIKEFYGPFKENLLKKDKEINKKDLTEEKSDEKCPKCGAPMIIKLGRFGKFMACTNYPDCKTTMPMGEEKELHEKHSNEVCEKCGKPMKVKTGRYGSFLGCSDYPACKTIKKIEKTIGMKCPKCLASPDLAKRDNPGELVEKKGKFKRIFYGCNQYPKCDYATSKKPATEETPQV